MIDKATTTTTKERRFSMNPKSMALFALLAVTAAGATEKAAPSITIKRLTLESATAIAQGAIKACRDKGIQIGVTVVDRNGLVQVALRDTLAPSITLEISKGKAAAAANFNVSTADLADRANTPIGRIPGLVMSAGGLPIEAGGTLYGAVGVSGAPSGETDAECAKAGIDRIQDELEMAM
jgi:uncharacterized protein GlcG (DUF336 family)